MQVTRYFEAVESLADSVNPLEYWKSQSHKYPTISAVAVDILAIPATSAPVERVFLLAGDQQQASVRQESGKGSLIEEQVYFVICAAF